MKEINNPGNLWSDSFIDDGTFSFSHDKDGNFDDACQFMKTVRCIKAYYDDMGKLHMIFEEVEDGVES